MIEQFFFWELKLRMWCFILRWGKYNQALILQILKKLLLKFYDIINFYVNGPWNVGAGGFGPLDLTPLIKV